MENYYFIEDLTMTDLLTFAVFLSAIYLCIVLSQLANKMNKIRRITDMAQEQKQSLLNTFMERENNNILLNTDSVFRETLQNLRSSLVELQEHWGNLSWGRKFKGRVEGKSPADIRKIKSALKRKETQYAYFTKKHKADIDKTKQYYNDVKKRIAWRIDAAKDQAITALKAEPGSQVSIDTQLKLGLMAGLLGSATSAAMNVSDSMAVYDTLKSVNGNFTDASDADIWFETLTMPPEQLAGLVSLTKGAHFEKLVASDTGGQLHEHFNHPDTDIIIDGEAVQLKATSSIDYINSVDSEIPVIATSEVAEYTRAIDSGISNEELTSMVEGSLGGDVLDLPDVIADGISGGVGGIGTFSTAQGLYQGHQYYKETGNKEKAVLFGLGITIKGTIVALLNLCQIFFKALASLLRIIF
jgi:hypothetical protein